MKLAYSPSSTMKTSGGASPAPNFTITADQVIVTPGSSTPAVNKDANTLIYDSSTVDTNRVISSDSFAVSSYESLNPEVATVSGNGYVQRVSNGTVRIRAVTGSNVQKLTTSVVRSDPPSVTQFSSWRSNTLAKFSNDRTIELTTGLSPGATSQKIYNGSTPSTTMFCRGYAGIRAIAYEVNGTSWMGFTAITTRHVIAAAHIGDYSGLQISFITGAGVRVNKTLTHRYQVPGVDVAVYLLDSSLSGIIAPIRMAPADLEHYIPNGQFPIPLIYTDRDHYANLSGTTSLTPSSFSMIALSDSRGGFYRPALEGTSGKPIMIPAANVSTSLLLVGLFSYATAGPTVYALPWTTIIPAVDAMAGISTGLQPERFPPIEAFNYYP